MSSNHFPCRPFSLRSNLTAARCLLALTALAFCLCTSRAAGQTGDNLSGPRQQLLDAVRLAGAPLFVHPRDPDDDFNDQWNRLFAIYQLRSASISDPQLDQAWSDIESQTKQCLLVLYRIAQIDNAKPSGLEIFAEAITSDNSQQAKDQTNKDAVNWLLSEAAMGMLRSQFRSAELNLENSIGELASVAGNLSPSQDSAAIGIQFGPSWDGTWDADSLQLTNFSGAAMDDAAIFVTVREASGSSRVHVYSVSHWDNGGTLAVNYPVSSGSYIPGEAAGTPASVTVTAMTANGSISSTFNLTQQVWDSMARAYCDPLKVSGHFLGGYTEDQTNQVYSPGVEFTLAGVSKLPIKSVTVYFWTGGAEPLGVTWNMGSDEMHQSGQIYDLRSPLFEQGDNALSAGSAPQHIALVFNLPDTSYQQVVRIY